MDARALRSIKSTAKQVGLSEATLRKYEKYGLIHPVVKSEAGYRFYDGLNVSRLLSCKRLRQCGFSLDKTAELLNTADLSEMGEVLAQRSEEIIREIQWQQNLLFQINSMRQEIVEYKLAQGKYEIIERPQIYCLEQQNWEKLSPSQQDTIKHWTDLFPVVRLTTFIQKNLDTNTFIENNFGYTISNEALEMLDVEDLNNVRCLPAGRFLTTVMECSINQNYLTEYIPSALAYLEEQGLAYDLDISMDTIVCTGSHDELKAFRRIWIRVLDE